ncbi:hypothetical protein HDE69_005326 [Pedobacter cryoconitis]|uniref:Uncharacterized protein n=1 Tax=Pedobacter cryoconitis TaxID=188932 RepID=A0A7W8YYN0_9SPHI|nr:hypothetical protein [Pedobacter cryoconitis]MBB5624229.1 hypothetical protein [Pedobacter cryoconitis]
MRTALFTFFNKYKYHILVWSIFIAYEAIIESLIGATELLKQPVLQTAALKMKSPRIPFENLPVKLPIIF